MDRTPESREDESPEAIRRDRDIEETRRQIGADLNALEHRLTRPFSLEELRTVVRENPLPWLVGISVVLLIATIALLRRLRQPDLPPLPPKGTRRRAVAETATVAEKEGLLSPEARTIIISLLTAEGLRWLRRYLSRQARHTSDEFASRARPVIHQARVVTSTTADLAQERLRETKHTAEEVIERIRTDGR